MPFIRVQKLVRDQDGNVVSGSASIIDVEYVKGAGKNHSRQKTRESLGAVIMFDAQARKGIFLSKSRGLVEYDSNADTFTVLEADDPRISGTKIDVVPANHVIFGDAYALVEFLRREGLLKILRKMASNKLEFQRVMAHTLHGILKNGAHETCEDFFVKSVASVLMPELPAASLKSDTLFFSFMGRDQTRSAFFKPYVAAMKRKFPNFGICCYVDSTPLPNDSATNPFNALCSHGLKGCDIQMRLVLLLDEETGLPVWYDIIPGNMLDVNTVTNLFEKVAAELDIVVDSLVVDAGYVSKEMVELCHIGTKKTMIGRMPAKKGYPYKDLYDKYQDHIRHLKYDFRREQHDYFGVREEITLFGFKTFAYVYVDRRNAAKVYGEFQDKHPEEYEALSDREREWYAIMGGYFVLLSNREETPREILDEYFERTDVECVFKTAKTFLDLLPIKKWTNDTVRGKILSDLINTIFVLMWRSRTKETKYALTQLIAKTQSLMCSRGLNDNLLIEIPNRQVKEIFQSTLGALPPVRLSLPSYRKETLLNV